jgi:large subunit ribosomal protein L11
VDPEPNRKVASVTWDVIKAIAEDKMVDLMHSQSNESMIAGTARSMV